MQSSCKNPTGGAEPPPLRSGENTARLHYPTEIAKCSQAAKTQRAEQSHRPYAVGRAALSGSAGQPPCNKLRPDKCN
ncbi:MAG: hypothetical protein RRY03_04340 [Oscillospiraceae bacterium]